MEKYMTVNGKRLFYKHSGAGPNVVLLHGIPTHSGLWDDVVLKLEKHCSVYAFDLLGFGRSDRAESKDLNIESQASIFREVLKTLSLNNVTLVGHDIGGGIVQVMAVSDPKLINALVLIDSACYDSWPIELLRTEGRVSMLFEHLPPEVIKELFIKYISDGMYNKDKVEHTAEKYWSYIDSPGGVRDFLNAVASLDSKYTMEIADRLCTIKLPTLILWGREDNYLRLSYAYRLSEDIARSKIIVLNEGGHFLPEDSPEQVAAEILEFLNKNKIINVSVI